MYTNMTLLSREAFDAAMDEMLSIRDAVRFLEKELKMRSLKSIIEKYAKGRDEKALKKLLVDGLLKDHPESNRDSVERRVRGWMDSKPGHSLHKKDAIEVAYLLGLDLAEADSFVAMVSGERLHWRNVDEVVYIYGLKQGMRYPQASALVAKMQQTLAKGQDKKEVPPEAFTSNVRQMVAAIETEEELESFLKKESARFGHYHNQAYQAFTEMLRQLQNPVSLNDAKNLWEGKNETLTIRDILCEYLYQDNVLYARGKAIDTKKMVKKGELPKEKQYILSKIQKEVADAWPDETTLSKMQSRKADVTRKVLILLFLATDNGLDGEFEKDIWEKGYSEEEYLEEESDFGKNYDEMTREEIFLDLKERLNLLLNLCGYAELDPRSPFDWMILYGMCAGDLLDIDDRMKQLFLEMYGNTEDEK